MSFNSLYTKSKYVVPIDARTSISLNGIDLRSFGFELTSMPDLGLPPVRQRNTTIDGRSGSIAMGDLYDNWSFDITGQLVGQSLEDAIAKKDNLLQWIDIEQMNMTKFVIGEKEYYGINFELAGAPLFYSDNTVSVTNGSKTITGSNTKFTNYVKPGVTFEVADDTKIYTVESVTDDDTLTLTENIVRTSVLERFHFFRLFTNLVSWGRVLGDMLVSFASLGDTFSDFRGYRNQDHNDCGRDRRLRP